MHINFQDFYSGWLALIILMLSRKNFITNRQPRLSVLIYLSVEHLIISNNDVRAEPYLTGLIIAATYYYYRSYKENKWIYILPGSLFLGMATMTKGIFIPAMVFSGFIIEWIIKKKWSEFIKSPMVAGDSFVISFHIPRIILPVYPI